MSYTVSGIDISAYDPFINWQKVKAQNIQFVIIKSTEGTNYFNPNFNDQWAGAKSVGILRGSYHYLRAQVDGAQQADYFLSKVNMKESELPPFLDIEGTNNQNAANNDFVNNAYKWLQRVEQLTGRRPIVYSTANFLSTKVSLGGKAPTWAANYQTWLAQYFYSYSANGQPTDAAGWGNWLFWQYSGDHDTLDGIYQDAAMTQKVQVDLDVYRYSINDLYKLANLTPPVTPPGPVPPTPPNPVPPTPPQPKTYTVQAGDTLPSIASSTQVVLNDLLAANPQLIRAGMQLNLPASANVPQPPAAPVTYTIRPGDNLTRVAAQFGVTVDAIVKFNNIANPDQISVGQVIKIPPK